MGLGEVFKLFATLGIDATEFDRALSQAESKLKTTTQAFSGAGRTLTAAVTAPIVGVGIGAIKAGADFEMAMNQVAAVSGATGEEFEQLRDLARELGATTQFSASQAAEAMNFMAMAGMNAQEIIGAMPDALKLAAAAQLDMGRTADIVTNILAGYGMGIDELGHAVDVLVQGFTSANTDLSMLAEAMKYAGPVANAAGVDFEEAAAALGLMGNAGIQASMAGTSLRGAITRMLNPTEKVQNIMKAAGLSFTDAEGRLLPLAEIIAQLEPHAENAGMFMEIFGQRAGPAMAALVSQGSDALRELTAQLEDSGGRADEVAAVQMQGFHGAMRLFKSAVEALMISIADSGLLEWLTGMVTGLAKLIQGLSETNPFLLRMATVLGALVASVGPALWMIGSFAGAVSNLLPLLRMVPGLLTGIRTALGLLTGPVGWIITAIGLIATAWATDFLGLRTLVTENWGKVVEFFSGAWDWIKGAATGFVDNLRTSWDALKTAGGALADNVRSNLDAIQHNMRVAGQGMLALFRGDWQGALAAGREILDNWWSGVNDLFGGLPQRVLDHATNLVRGFRDGFVNTFNSVRQALGSAATTALDTVRGAVSSGWSAVTDLFTRANDRIRGNLDALQHNVTIAGHALAAIFRGDWQGALNHAREIFDNWWSGLNDFLGGLPQKMLDFGKDLIQGLIDGVKSMITGAVDAVKGVGESVINGFKGLLGIESPSKVFRDIGMDIGEGLAQGIEASEARVAGAVDRLAAAASERFFGSRTVGTVDTSAWARAVTEGLEGRDAIHALQRALRDIESQRAATLGTGSIGRLARGILELKTDALEAELRRLSEELYRSRVAAARDAEVQTRRFSMAVGTFDQGVRGLQLARQRY